MSDGSNYVWLDGIARVTAMNMQRERRLGVDRREHAIYYRYGAEHRENTERRIAPPVGTSQPAHLWVIALRDVARILWR